VDLLNLWRLCDPPSRGPLGLAYGIKPLGGFRSFGTDTGVCLGFLRA
jgi:hypothetical protein